LLHKKLPDLIGRVYRYTPRRYGPDDTTQQTQRTFARVNLLQTCCMPTCYVETGVTDDGL